MRNSAFYSIQAAFLIVIALMIAFCDAPRDNPVDPGNSAGRYSRLEGHVHSLNVPFVPIGDAQVTWLNDNITVRSNSAGYFHIINSVLSNGWLVFSKQNYQTDSVFVDWQNRRDVFLEVYLNYIPRLDSFIVYSTVKNRLPDIQEFFLTAIANIVDPDKNDIDSVFLVAEELEFKSPLIQVNAMRYQKELTEADLPISKFQKIIGKKFSIVIQNDRNGQFQLGEQYVKRIITDNNFFIVSPSNNATVIASPTFSWGGAFQPGFDFTYTIEVYTNRLDLTTQRLVWWKEKISPSLSPKSLMMDSQLSPGDYQWILICVDEFSNSARSTAGTFNVQ
jgi:hypothetical protein